MLSTDEAKNGETGRQPGDGQGSSNRGVPLVHRLLRAAEAYGLLVGLLITVLVFSTLLPNVYLSGPNLASMLGSQAVLVVVTLGLIIALSANEFDLSIGGVVTLSAMTVALLNVDRGLNIWVSVAVALLVGAVVGLTNGFFAVGLGVNSLIVTLGTGTFIGGVVFWLSDSRTITGLDSQLVEFVLLKQLFGIPYEFYYAILLAAVVWYVFEFTPLGQRLLFTGQNVTVARLSGINTGRIRWMSLIASSTIAALGGVLYAGTTGSADPTSGQAILLPAFAAAFLGATTIKPGRFNAWGSVIAVYFLIAGITGLQLLGAQNFVQQLFYGGALVIAVTLAQLSARKRA